MKEAAKKQEVKEAGELSEKHQKLISWGLDELHKVFILGSVLSRNEREDIAYAGRVIVSVLEDVSKELWAAVGRDSHYQDPNPNEEIPF